MLATSFAGIEVWWLALALLIVFIGSATQSAIGVGLGLLAAPTLSLIDPAFIPGAITVAVVPLTLGMAVREREHVDRSGMATAVPGRFIGVLIGTWTVANTGDQVLAIIIGASVLLAVIGSLTGIRFDPTRRNLFVAGTASGFSGSAAGVGGPPMALTYQHADPRVLRSTLAAFNLIGSCFTIPSLAIAGVIGSQELQLATLMVPAVLLGLLAGKPLIARLPPEQMRRFVLVTCAASALVLLIRQLL